MPSVEAAPVRGQAARRLLGDGLDLELAVQPRPHVVQGEPAAHLPIGMLLLLLLLEVLPRPLQTVGPVVAAPRADRPAVVVHQAVVVVGREPLLDGRAGDAVGEQALGLPLALQLNQASDLEAPAVHDGGRFAGQNSLAPLMHL